LAGKNWANTGVRVAPSGGGVSGGPGVSAAVLCAAANGEVVQEVVLEHCGQLRLLDDDVPVPVAVPCGVGVRGPGERIDVGLVGVVPVAVGRPARGTVADLHIDVVCGG